MGDDDVRGARGNRRSGGGGGKAAGRVAWGVDPLGVGGLCSIGVFLRRVGLEVAGRGCGTAEPFIRLLRGPPGVISKRYFRRGLD